MTEKEIDLRSDLSGALDEVGDRRLLEGSATGILEGYELSFLEGERIEWSLDALRIAGGVELSGRVSGIIELECNRCLAAYEQEITLELFEHLLWLESEKMEPGDDYAGEYAVIDGVLDLSQVLRDAICLGLPSVRVCSPECRGICPGCGADLNREPCRCSGEKSDPRLKPLEDIRKRLEGEGSG